MERTVLTWNIPNWITVLLMAGAGYLAFMAIVQGTRWMSPSGNANDTQNGAGT